MRNWKMILSFPFLEESKRERERERENTRRRRRRLLDFYRMQNLSSHAKNYYCLISNYCFF
jgi:hypothetical protein